MNKKAALQRSGIPASDLLEEAVRLLRRAPVSTLPLHLVGSVPCMLGALYFLADMSHSAFASSRLFEASLALAALYVWMKCWQAVFAAHLRAVLLREAPPRWTAARIRKSALLRLPSTERPAAAPIHGPHPVLHDIQTPRPLS